MHERCKTSEKGGEMLEWRYKNPLFLMMSQSSIVMSVSSFTPFFMDKE